CSSSSCREPCLEKDSRPRWAYPCHVGAARRELTLALGEHAASPFSSRASSQATLKVMEPAYAQTACPFSLLAKVTVRAPELSLDPSASNVETLTDSAKALARRCSSWVFVTASSSCRAVPSLLLKSKPSEPTWSRSGSTADVGSSLIHA